jgi:hypothetical protein
MPYHLHNYSTQWEKKNQKLSNRKKLPNDRKVFCVKQNAFLICLEIYYIANDYEKEALSHERNS